MYQSEHSYMMVGVTLLSPSGQHSGEEQQTQSFIFPPLILEFKILGAAGIFSLRTLF